jgi:hypothetical protein
LAILGGEDGVDEDPGEGLSHDGRVCGVAWGFNSFRVAACGVWVSRVVPRNGTTLGWMIQSRWDCRASETTKTPTPNLCAESLSRSSNRRIFDS